MHLAGLPFHGSPIVIPPPPASKPEPTSSCEGKGVVWLAFLFWLTSQADLKLGQKLIVSPCNKYTKIYLHIAVPGVVQ